LKSEFYDILLISETWLNPNFSDSEIISGTDYTLFRQDRCNRIGGGVAMLCRKYLKIKIVSLPDRFKQLELLACDLRLNNLAYRLLLCYRSPTLGHDDSCLLFQAIQQLASETKSTLLLVGDFNLPEIKWDKAEFFGENTLAYEFIQTINILGLTQLVHTPTLERNILDLILCSHHLLISKLEVTEPFSTSDHNSIYFEVCDSSDSEPELMKRDFAKGNYEQMNIELHSLCWPEIFSDCANVNDFYLKFQNILIFLIEKYVPFRKPRSRFRYPKNIRILQSKKKNLWKRLKGNPNLKERYRDLNKATEKAILNFQASKERKLLEKGTNFKKFYNFVNNKLNVKTSVPDLEVEGLPVTDKFAKASAFNEFFGSVFTEDNGNLPHFEKIQNLPFLKIVFKFENVLAALNQLKPTLASGPDFLNAYLLKKLKDSITEPLSTIFEVSYRTGKLPDLWLKALVTPIFKKGSQDKVENYRPISLCCVTCKLMESIVNKSLTDFLKTNNILRHQQFGFQKDKSCSLQLLNCTNNWINCLDQKKSVDVVYIDFQKAFDTVVHSKLLHKLEAILPNRFLKSWIKSFLSGRSQIVTLDGTVSEPIPVSSGVPQGSVLGPTLFLIYINDLVDTIKHSLITLFADDLKIYNTSDQQKLLQSDLDSLSSWASEWQLSVSHSKSNVLYLGKKNPKHPYSLNSQPLEDVGISCKDLGVYISNNLGSSIQCKNIVSKASRVSALVLRSFVSKDRNLLIRAFKTYVRPLLEYATVVWSPHLICDINSVENIQRRFTKRVLAGSNFSYDDRLRIINLDRLELRRIHFDAIMTYNILKRDLLPSEEFYSFPGYRKTRSQEKEVISIEKFRLDVKKFGFKTRSAYIWNCVPSETKNSISLNTFKKGILEVDFSKFLKGRK
jgi:hypothetical protein